MYNALVETNFEKYKKLSAEIKDNLSFGDYLQFVIEVAKR